MSNSNPSFGAKRKNTAIKSDGFVDYYELIHEEKGSSVAQLSAAIDKLQKEAEANRDHRNLNKRHYYKELLELLPEAKKVLLDETIKNQYDAYRETALQGNAPQNFDEWRETVLSVNEDNSEVESSTPQKNKQKKSKKQDKAEDVPPPVPSASIGIIIALISYALMQYLFKLENPIPILAAITLGLVVWAVLSIAQRKSPEK